MYSWQILSTHSLHLPQLPSAFYIRKIRSVSCLVKIPHTLPWFKLRNSAHEIDVTKKTYCMLAKTTWLEKYNKKKWKCAREFLFFSFFIIVFFLCSSIIPKFYEQVLLQHPGALIMNSALCLFNLYGSLKRFFFPCPTWVMGANENGKFVKSLRKHFSSTLFSPFDYFIRLWWCFSCLFLLHNLFITQSIYVNLKRQMI